MNITELDENSPIASQPHNARLPLKRHQLTLLHRCLEFESSKVQITGETSRSISTQNPPRHMETSIGIIGDRVGSGKSFVILSLMLTQDQGEGSNVSRGMVSTYGRNKIIVFASSCKPCIKTNLLVVPHNLVAQWTDYIQAFCPPTFTYVIVNKSKIFNDVVDTDLGNYDLIVTTCTFYNRLATVIRQRGLKMKRVFYDEVDNLNIPSCEEIESGFYWFVTASYLNLIYPRGHSRYDRSIQRYVMIASGIRNSGYVKDVFNDLSSAEPKISARTLIVRNSDDYIKTSIMLPEPINNYVKCKTPHTINILNGIVDMPVINHLNAGDIDNAILSINPANRCAEDNIVKIIIDKYERNLKNIETSLSMIDSFVYETPAERQVELERLLKRKNEVVQRIECIKERIRQSETCSICFDDINNKTIVSCCSNAFCFRCIHVWLARKSSCPLCKGVVSPTDIYVVDNATTSQRSILVEDYSDRIHESNDKVRNLRNILRSLDNDGKILIFSASDSSFVQIADVLQEEGIQFAYLKGNQIQKAMNEYKNGSTKVLLVNSVYYGCGLNLENTTDIIMFHKFNNEIEKQVIGRAQRYGRTSSLRIWYLLYENEMESVRSMT